MGQRKTETPGKTPKNKGVKLRTEEEEETAHDSTQNEGQAAMQISIEVERNKYADQTAAEKAEVDQKVAGAAVASEINREDKSMEPKCPEKMVSVKKNRKKNAAKLVDGAESAGSLAAETVDVDKFAAEQKSSVIVADESKNEDIVADKPINEEYVKGEQEKEVIIDSKQIIVKPEQKFVQKAKLEMESPGKVKKVLEVAKADESATEKVELQQNKPVEAERKSTRIWGVYQNQGLTSRQRKRLRQQEQLNNLEEAETKVTGKAETKQKLSEKMEIDGTMEEKLGNEQSEGKCKKRNKRKRAKKEKGGEVKKITQEEGVNKATVEEGQTKKITQEEGEVKKITQGEGQAKTMKVDGTVEKEPENDQSKSKKKNGAHIEKEGQMKKTRQEEIATEEKQKKSDATEVIEMLVNSLTEDELKEILKSSPQPGLLAHINRVASRDKLKRTLYVQNLNCETNSKILRNAFLQYGKIENAKVVVDKESGKCMGFAFVEFCTKSSALSALRNPIKEINGERCHCSLKIPRRRSSINSYMAIHGPMESVYPATHGPIESVYPAIHGPIESVYPAIHGPIESVYPAIHGPIESVYPAIHGPIESVYPAIHGTGGFVNPATLIRGEYVNPNAFGSRVNSTFPGHLNSQAVLGNFQFSNQWGHSNLQYGY